MTTLSRLLLLVFVLLPSAVAAPLSPDETAAVERAESRGRLLYMLDRAAWVSTDTLMAQSDRLSGLTITEGGWIVEVDAGRLIVTYFRVEGGAYEPFYVADVENGRVTADRFTIGETPHLTPVQRRMMQARIAATAKELAPCTPVHMNTVVVPPADAAAPVEVYVMSAQAQMDEYPFGGHYLLSVGPDGTSEQVRSFTKSCLNLSPGKQAAGMFVTHLLDPVPTEIHVFTSLSANMPVMVSTPGNGRTWELKGDTITLMDPP